jgi:hypothetical protein
MNKGVEILLARMESNPEEFVPDVNGRYPRKWRDTLEHLQARVQDKNAQDRLMFLADADINMLWAKMQSIRGDLFTKQVMNTLLQDSVDTLTLQKDLNDTYWKAYGATTVLPITPPRKLSSLLQQADCGSPKEKP